MKSDLANQLFNQLVWNAVVFSAPLLLTALVMGAQVRAPHVAVGAFAGDASQTRIQDLH